MTEQPNPNELLLITREELERCCSQMSAAGYKVSANYVEASVLSRSRPAPAAPSQERIGSIRQTIYQEDAYLIERVNAGMGEWEYVIQYCGEYYATAPTENIARDIVERAQWSRPAPAALETEHEQYERICKEVSQEQHDATIRNDFLEKAEHLAQTIPDFNRMDYIHLLKESLRSPEAPK